MPEQSPRGPLWMSIVGRSAVAVLVTLVGLILGLVGGGYRGYVAANAIPPAPTTMGFESAGIAPLLLFAVHVALGAVAGAGGRCGRGVDLAEVEVAIGRPA